MPEIKWRRLGENQYRCVLHFIVLSYSRNGFSKDFIMYVRDPGGFMVALVIRRCVNATEQRWRQLVPSRKIGVKSNVSAAREVEG